MDMITGRGEGCRITETRFDLTLACEAGGEYTMPDYYPEVRRIVSYTAEALPDTKFLSGDTLEAGGTLAFTVTYIGEDGAIVALPYATEYSGKIQLPSEVRGAGEICIDAECEDVQCRVLAPRRISIRGRVRQRIYSDCEREYFLSYSDGEGGSVSPSDKGAVQLLEGIVPVTYCARGMATGSVSGEIRDRQGAKPISCMGIVGITDARARTDAVLVTGCIYVRGVVFTADGVYTQAKGTIPFEETVSVKGAKEGDACRAWGRVASISLSEDGEGRLKAECEYDIDAEWCRKGQVTCAFDAYSTSFASKVERSDVYSMSPVCCLNSPLTVSGSGKRSSATQNGEYLIDMQSRASIDSVELKGDRAIFTGKCIVKAYIASDGEVICEEISLPIKYECTAMAVCDGGKPVIRSFVSVTDVSGRLEGDAVFASCELCLSISCRQVTMISPVREVVLDKNQRIASHEAEIRVCYPSDGEGILLWDAAKKYLCDVSRVENANGAHRTTRLDSPVIIPRW